MSRRSWLQQSAHRPGGGLHADSRAWRERDALALDEAYAEARALDAADADLDAQADHAREAQERRP